MIKKINNLIRYIDDENSIFHKRLVAIAERLSEPFFSIEVDLDELKSMVDPEFADKKIKIDKVEIKI